MISSLSPKIFLVTGATAGIGFETALGLARLGATVILHGRDPARLQSALQRVRSETGNHRAESLAADLARPDDIARLAADLQRRFGSLHGLVHNAGILLPRRDLADNGCELTFAVNHLAPYLLTGLLLDSLRAAAPARIVVVASDAHRLVRRFDLAATVGAPPSPSAGLGAYARSKLANILFTRELHRRLALHPGPPITVNALHPGAVRTEIFRRHWLLRTFVAPFFLTPAQGARTTLHLATDPGLSGVSGRYFTNSRETEPSLTAQEDTAARALWKRSAELVGLDYP